MKYTYDFRLCICNFTRNIEETTLPLVSCHGLSFGSSHSTTETMQMQTWVVLHTSGDGQSGGTHPIKMQRWVINQVKDNDPPTTIVTISLEFKNGVDNCNNFFGVQEWSVGVHEL